MKYRIKVQDRDYVIEKGLVILGRGKEADLQVHSKSLSRLHARIVLEGDRLTIDDLASKNGTFVNNTRITASTAITAGDAVRLADLAVTITPVTAEPSPAAGHAETPPMPVAPVSALPAPSAGPAPVQAAPLPAPTAADQRLEASCRAARGRLIRNLAAVGIIVLVVIAAVKMWPEDDRLPAARETLARARKVYSAAVDAGRAATPERLDDVIREADRTIRDLDAIGMEFPAEYHAARALAGKLDKVHKDAVARGEGLRREAEQRVQFQAIMDGFNAGTLGPVEAAAQLQALAAAAAGTPQDGIYFRKAEEIRTAAIARSRGELQVLAAEVRTELAAGRFGAALVLLDRNVAPPFPLDVKTGIADLNALRAEVPAAYDAATAALETEVLAIAGRDEFDTAQARVGAAAGVWGMPDTAQRQARIAARIEGLRQERLAAALARIRADLDAAQADFDKRFYQRSAASFRRIADGCDNPLVRAEVERSYRVADLLRGLKEEVISRLGAEGLDFKAVADTEGRITAADNEGFMVELDGNAMRFRWDYLGNAEFARLLGLVLPLRAEAWLAAGILLKLAEPGQGDEDILKAGRMQPGLRDAFPWVFAAVAEAPAAAPKEQPVEHRWADSAPGGDPATAPRPEPPKAR
ncbi:MAG: FHA domain-containing protein [Planctomycetota bacterium]